MRPEECVLVAVGVRVAAGLVPVFGSPSCWGLREEEGVDEVGNVAGVELRGDIACLLRPDVLASSGLDKGSSSGAGVYELAGRTEVECALGRVIP